MPTKEKTKDYAAAKALLGEALGRPPEEIGADATIGETQGWDSLAHLRLLLALEEKLGKELPGTMVVAIKTIEDVQSLIDTGALPQGREARW